MLPSPAKWDFWMPQWWCKITWLLQVAFHRAQAPKFRLPSFQPLSVTSPFKKVQRQRDTMQIVGIALKAKKTIIFLQMPYHGKSARSDHPSLNISPQLIWKLPADESRSCSCANSHVLLVIPTGQHQLYSNEPVQGRKAGKKLSLSTLSSLFPPFPLRKGRGLAFQSH